jgi:hypothetical protein
VGRISWRSGLQTGGTGRLVRGDRQIGSKENGKLRWKGIGGAEYTVLGGFLFGCFKFGGLGSGNLLRYNAVGQKVARSLKSKY